MASLCYFGGRKGENPRWPTQIVGCSAYRLFCDRWRRHVRGEYRKKKIRDGGFHAPTRVAFDVTAPFFAIFCRILTAPTKGAFFRLILFLPLLRAICESRASPVGLARIFCGEICQWMLYSYFSFFFAGLNIHMWKFFFNWLVELMQR